MNKQEVVSTPDGDSGAKSKKQNNVTDVFCKHRRVAWMPPGGYIECVGKEGALSRPFFLGVDD